VLFWVFLTFEDLGEKLAKIEGRGNGRLLELIHIESARMNAASTLEATLRLR